MKIVFDSEAERDDFAQNMGEVTCPSQFGLKEDWCRCDWKVETNEKQMTHCYDCWKDALDEVAEIKE